MDGRVIVAWRDLDGRVGLGGRRPADEQRYLEALALHLLGVVDHLVQRGRDEPGEPDDVRVPLPGGLEDLLDRHHHPEVYYLEVVALQHDAYDVLADIVNVALHSRHHHRAVRLAGLALLLFDKRDQVRDRLLHHAGALDHLRQEHPARAEEVPDHVHPVHEWTLDHVERTLGLLSCLLRVLLDVL